MHAVLGSCKRFRFTTLTRAMMVPKMEGHGMSRLLRNVDTICIGQEKCQASNTSGARKACSNAPSSWVAPDKSCATGRGSHTRQCARRLCHAASVMRT